VRKTKGLDMGPVERPQTEQRGRRALIDTSDNQSGYFKRNLESKNTPALVSERGEKALTLCGNSLEETPHARNG